MSGTKDHGIRLFGRTIQLAQNDDVSAADCEQSFDHNFCCSNGSVSPQSFLYKNPTNGGDSMDLVLEHVSSNSIVESNNEDHSKSSTEEQGGSQEKPLKKPTKIIPCPRCESSDTKFCYFNNYNANQPRHFCKNCQRYWTAGGSMRNMPVGAGRRKNKTNPHPIVIPNAFQPHQDSTLENLSHQDNGHGFSGPLWLSPWNPAHASSSMPPHAFLPLPIYTGPPYWNMRWMHQAPNTPLGKHPRDANKLKGSNKEHQGEEKTTESKVLVPKTLRFDDPSEAAKSSIWTTLGMKAHKSSGCYDSSAFFGRFSKGDETSTSSRVLNANPAALSRSLTFHETAR